MGYFRRYYGLFYFLYKTLELKPASYLSMMSMMFSVMVALLQYILFGIILRFWQIIGATIIILAVVLLEIYTQKTNYNNSQR